jgi:predicted ribonuclease YlaK
MEFENSMKDIRWKWLKERGFNVLADRHQYAYMQALWQSPDIVQAVFCEAKAGTGKTTLAVLAGIYEVEKGNYDRLIYLRNAIPLRDQGFLPGNETEKNAPFMAPLVEALEYVQPGYYEKYSVPSEDGKRQPKVVAMSTAFTRGINWKNSFIVIDEAQSFDLEELQAVYTRAHDSSKIVTTGSLRQVDNKKIKRIAGFLPLEVYMEHFKGTSVSYNKLEKNYRGWFSNHADNVMETVNRLKEGV